ncbi:MAG TPA: polyprenyl synthetase family protein [Streptosporangiaceae bacterium]|jgi:geranylgeranyl diphosphate synthase type I|nr:polyprenyl synthetase family protein [Streptosporangiaceae bacterium]
MSVDDTPRLLIPEMRELIYSLESELSAVCAYHVGLPGRYDVAPAGRGGGKHIRASFTVLCAEATGGSAADALGGALAVEFVHNASLIHDDIMDGDPERRGRPAVWRRFGVPMAILAGDALLGLAFEALARWDRAGETAIHDLARTVRRLCDGQSSDLCHDVLSGRSMSDYLRMIEGKTGVLLGLACRLGAMASAGPPAWLDKFEQFGVHLGVAFQLVDDTLGIWGDPALTGKPHGSDLRGRKKSAPVLAALAANNIHSRRLAELLARGVGDDDLGYCAELIASAGGRRWVRLETRRRVEAAWDSLARVDMDPMVRDELVKLVDFLVTREW